MRYQLQPIDNSFIIFDTQQKIILASCFNCRIKNCLPLWDNEQNIIKALKINQKITEGDLIDAAKYGYDFHKNSQFPDHEFEQACVNNFAQYRQYKTQIPHMFVEIEEFLPDHPMYDGWKERGEKFIRIIKYYEPTI